MDRLTEKPEKRYNLTRGQLEKISHYLVRGERLELTAQKDGTIRIRRVMHKEI